MPLKSKSDNYLALLRANMRLLVLDKPNPNLDIEEYRMDTLRYFNAGFNIWREEFCDGK